MSLNAGAARVAELARRIEAIARQEERLPDAESVVTLGVALEATTLAINVHLDDSRIELATSPASAPVMDAPMVALGSANAAVSANHFQAELAAAISTGEIQPFFQPIVSRGDARLVGVEALARWVKFDGTVIPPGNSSVGPKPAGLSCRWAPTC